MEGASLQHEEGLCFKIHVTCSPFDLSFPTLSLFRFVFIWKRVGRRRRRKGDYVCGCLWMLAERILSVHQVLSQDWNWMASAFAHRATSLPHPHCHS